MAKACFRGMASLILFIAGSIVSTGSYALPFSITPTAGISLPTEVLPGHTVTAIYTVTNNTSAVRSGNFVKYLPPNVAQVAVDPVYSDLCGSAFTLNPRGTSGSSCTLELKISGNVNANDPDPHHHLFVCFPGGITCAGTPNPLNVSTKTVSAPEHVYISNYNANTVSVCSVNPSTGQLILCQDSGAGAVFSTPINISFNPDKSRLYAGDFNNSAGTSVQDCLVNSATGILSGCSNVDGDGSAVFSGPSFVAFSFTGSNAYVSNLASGIISLCLVNTTTGKFTGCASTGSGFSFPVELNLSIRGTRAYVGNDAISTTVSLCTVDTTTGALTGCANADGDGTAVFAGPAFIAFNADETRVYVSNNNSGTGTTVTLCSVNLVTGKLTSCQDSGAGAIFTSPASVRLNPANTLLYIGNQTGTSVTLCSANPATGLLSGCINADGDGTAVFSGPAGIILK
jgi:DNA-binding beta-propeller fold protein YncE